MKNRLLWRWGILFWLLFSGFIAYGQDDKYFKLAKGLDQMAAVYQNLNTYYVDSLNPVRLMESGIEAMTQALDPYTVFYSEENTNRLTFQTTGLYTGIGAAFRSINDSVVLSALLPHAPFEKAGFKPGDIIISLDNKDITGMEPEEVHAFLEGTPHTELEVKVLRPWTGEIIRKTIKRAEIKIPSISYKTVLKNNIGYIRFERFTKGSAEEFKKALLKLQKEDGNMPGLIIDLRGNPGGLLDEAVKMSNFFLPVGDTIVQVKGRIPSWNKVYTATQKPLDPLLPLAVLIDEHSASAAEIFAGAMQDLDRGIILGQQSFGKGLVQTTRSLPYDAKLKVTVARYYTPSGRCIQAIDYAHKDAYGNPIHIADSMKQQFTKVDGRIVEDQGGITPDKVIKSRYLSNWTSALINDNAFFRFATKYVYMHPRVPPLEGFKVDDSLFLAFERFLEKHPGTYESRSESMLERFKASAISEEYFDSVRTTYDALKKAINAYTHPPVSSQRKEVSRFLAGEIMNCYYARKGRIAAGIASDSAIKEAVRTLVDKKSYSSILR